MINPRDVEQGPAGLPESVPVQGESPTPGQTLARAGPRRRRPTWGQVLVSLLIAGLGLLASRALGIVDQDLRIIYTEYTLAAADLAHTSSDLLRYRVTIIRAIEAQTPQEFERISASLPDQRRRILVALERYEAASQRTSSVARRHTEDVHALRQSLDAYFASADKTMAFLFRLWQAGSPGAAADLRHQAEVHAADHAGPKLVEASNALERLLVGVAEVGKHMRDEGSGVIRATTLALVLGSLLIAALNLFA